MDIAALDPALRQSSNATAAAAPVAVSAGPAGNPSSSSSSSSSTTTPTITPAPPATPLSSSNQSPRGPQQQLPGPTQEPLHRAWHSASQTQPPATPNNRQLLNPIVPVGQQPQQASAPLPSIRHAQQTATGHSSPPAPSPPPPPPPSGTLQHAQHIHSPPAPVGPASSAAFSPQSPTAAHSPPNNNPSTDPKKPRACESCRSLKVRCDPDPADPEGACKRCKKAKRECVITQPTRKRQKKTDSRVAELEKKIDALTQSLVATRNPVTGPGIIGQAQGAGIDEGGGRYGLVLQQQHQHQHQQQYQHQHQQPQGSGEAQYGVQQQHGVKRKAEEMVADRDRAERGGRMMETVATPQCGEKSSGSGAGVREADVVDREVLSMTLAGELFARYTTQMCQHLPGVVFPAGTTVSELRATKPILFLSVMAAASSEMPGLQRILTKELMQVFAEKIIIDGQKSLELVQALHVAVIWYWPPERFEELKFYQLVHVAAVMAIEIGLGRKKQARGGFRKHIATAWKDHPLRNTPPDPTTIEARRTWLTCYFLATNTSMALHRANLIRWTPFMAECMDVLESSPEAAPTDKYFCSLVWTHKLAEEVGIQFSMDDAAYTPNIADSRTQYALRGFERELERYSSSIPRELQQPSLKMSFHVISLYMHEIATHSGDGADDLRLCNGIGIGGSDNALASDVPLSPAHINALSACLIAIDGIFETFLSLDVKNIRCLPVFNFVRVAYAVVVLIKLYFAASSANSELGKVINKDNMKVEQHLDGLLDKFRATAAEDRSRPAAKFLVVLIMLRTWFQKQKQNQGKEETPASTPYASSRQGEKDLKTPTPAPAQHQQAPPPPQGYTVTASMATTPLELLSEMAAASAGNTNTTAGVNIAPTPRSMDILQQPGPGVGSSWMNRQMVYDPAATASPSVTPRQQQQDANVDTPADGSTGPATFHPMNNSHNQGMPWIFGGNSNSPFGGLDFDYTTLGDGFAQAMDMTLGGFADGSWMTEDGVKYILDDTVWYPPGVGVGVGSGAGYGF